MAREPYTVAPIEGRVSAAVEEQQKATFADQASAERAYYQVLGEWLERGQHLAKLQRRIGSQRYAARNRRARIKMLEKALRALLDSLTRMGDHEVLLDSEATAAMGLATELLAPTVRATETR